MAFAICSEKKGGPMGNQDDKSYAAYYKFFGIVFVISLAFFAPPELCEFYHELCTDFRFLVYFDKVFHFLFFAGLAVFCPGCDTLGRRLWLMGGLIVFGIIIEIFQGFIPERTVSIGDVIANILGALVGILVRAKLQQNRSA